MNALTTETMTFPIGTSLAEVERRYILRALELHQGNKSAAARTVGVSLKTIFNRLNAFERDGHIVRKQAGI